MPFVNTEVLNVPILRDRITSQGLLTLLLILYLKFCVILVCVLIQDTQVPCVSEYFFLNCNCLLHCYFLLKNK